MVSADQLIATLEGLDGSSFGNESERFRARQALYSALRRVDTPWDIAMAQCMTEPLSTATIKIFIDADLWKKWAAAGGKPSSSEELAKISGVDPVLAQRLLRHLAKEGFITLEDDEKYGLTDFSRELGTDIFPHLYHYLYLFNQPAFANFPKFMAETNYANPSNPDQGNVQSWMGRPVHFFDLYSLIPGLKETFSKCMTCYANVQTPWVEVYPTETLVADQRPGGALVVDVGGGRGHDLEKIRAKHPDVAPGSYVLQDLEAVISQAQVQGPATVTQAHDFFARQPVKGARVYYLHSVLHDWPDHKAVEILRNLAAAMEKGYSRVLVHEMVVRGVRDSHPRVLASDLSMMVSLSAAERSEESWAKLADQAGLKIIKIWSAPQSVSNIIELDLV